LAWRRSFSRLEAVDVIERSIRAAELEGVTYLEPEGVSFMDSVAGAG
jgi:hypothetical protein